MEDVQQELIQQLIAQVLRIKIKIKRFQKIYKLIKSIFQDHQMQKSQQDTVYSYLLNTKFYDSIRNKLHGHLTAQELKQLIKGIESVSRYKPGNFICTFDQQVYIIVIYGEIICQEKCYTKGQYFQIKPHFYEPQIEGENKMDGIQIIFLKPTTLMLINLEVLEFRIQQIKRIRQNMKIIETCLPIKQLKLSYSQIRKLAKLLTLNQIHIKFASPKEEFGIFFFYEGIHQLCYEGIPILQLENNFAEITENKQFLLKLKSNHGKYGFIAKQEFYAIVDESSGLEMEKIWRTRIQLKSSIQVKKQYIEAAECLRERIRKKMKKQKKISENQKHKFQANYQQQLESSRKTMLKKCSTAVTATSFSLGSSRKTATSMHYQSKTALNWSALKEKQTLDFSKTEQRLNKMRQLSHRKQKTKLQKEWYHLEQNKMKSTLDLSYFKIKSVEKNPQEIKKMCNFKRVHRIYSDPCFKKTLTFRSY